MIKGSERLEKLRLAHYGPCPGRQFMVERSDRVRHTGRQADSTVPPSSTADSEPMSPQMIRFEHGSCPICVNVRRG